MMIACVDAITATVVMIADVDAITATAVIITDVNAITAFEELDLKVPWKLKFGLSYR